MDWNYVSVWKFPFHIRFSSRLSQFKNPVSSKTYIMSFIAIIVGELLDKCVPNFTVVKSEKLDPWLCYHVGSRHPSLVILILKDIVPYRSLTKDSSWQLYWHFHSWKNSAHPTIPFSPLDDHHFSISLFLFLENSEMNALWLLLLKIKKK